MLQHILGCVLSDGAILNRAQIEWAVDTATRRISGRARAFHPVTAVAILLSRQGLSLPSATACANVVKKQTQAPEQLRLALSLVRSGSSLSTASRHVNISVTTIAVAARTEGLQIASRPKVLTTRVREKIVDMASRGMEVRRITRMTSLSLATVGRVLRENPSVRRRQKLLTELRERSKRRGKWLEGINKWPRDTKTGLRKHLPGTYAWLYKNDTRWLDRIQYPRQPHRHGVRRGIGIDRRPLLEHLRQVASEIRHQAGRPMRITRSRLLHTAGLSRDMCWREDTVNQQVARLCESDDDWVSRRLAWATRELENAGLPVAPWRVRRLASIRDQRSDRRRRK